MTQRLGSRQLAGYQIRRSDMLRRRSLILAYHSVDPTWDSRLAITQAALDAHARYLSRHGYVGLTATEAEILQREEALPERSVVFTFDDGYISTLRAADILSAYGYPGTVFVVTSFVESGDPLAWFGLDGEDVAHLQPLDWDGLSRLAASGWEIGSHTHTHPLLTNLDDAGLCDELITSQRLIEQRLGSCTSLAYPYGIADSRVATAAAAVGYRTAVTLTGVAVADRPLLRSRIGLFSGDRGVRLGAKLSTPAVGLRRSAAAKLVRRLHGSRSWIPPSPAERP
jgi:peptidoglycan/xylan/chitin deacetylase (PgdA/CDA1 family)